LEDGLYMQLLALVHSQWRTCLGH